MKKIWLLVLVLLCALSLPASAAGEIIYQGDTNSNHIYLTFDDGHSYKNTRDILDILKEKNVPATFFIEGDFLVQNPILINRIVKEQTLGNHTMCHKDITKLTNQQFREDIEKYEKAVFEITGQPVTKYFRPPMGKINKNKQAILNELEYTIFKWDVSYYDYVYYDDRGVEFALNNILKQTKNGSIILMHTLTKSNVRVLGTAIDKLREKGFVFSDLSELA
ncbi:MAG: polysaccharide deacetylase family protein [Anaeroplasmataceae bacterium]|nr:polysaccharide deacetylase family protein [Anaeroplasmataceae bacterium]MDE6414299.1 polysaccharide deacetylase family protein [Anaeroplasmataceae bacterium]